MAQRKKHYCFFSAQFLPHMGGVERYTYNLARELVRKGNEVTVVTSNVERVKSCEKMDGIRVFRLPCWNAMGGRFPIPKYNREFYKLSRKISEGKYDLIVVNTRFYLHSLYGLFFGRRKHVRTIFVEHGTGHLTVHQAVLDFFERVVEHGMTFIERLFCKEFYGVSKACLSWLRHFHIQGKGTLYNSIDLEEVEALTKTPALSFREKYQIPKDAVVVSFTGRLLKEKGILTLIQAVSNINRQNQKVYLLIAGDGDEEERVQKAKTEHILPLGRISYAEIIALLNESDLFCLPSDSEGMPTSVLEAVACKCFVITTQRGGAKELLPDETYGLVLEKNDLASVQGALEKAIRDQAYRQEAAQKAYQRLRKGFTWSETAEKLMSL